VSLAGKHPVLYRYLKKFKIKERSLLIRRKRIFSEKSERILQGSTNAEHRGWRGVGKTIKEKDFAMRDIDRIYRREDLRSSRPSSFRPSFPRTVGFGHKSGVL